MKIFIEVQIGYRQSACMFYEKILNRKINCLHEQSLGIVYRASTISLYALLKKNNILSLVTTKNGIRTHNHLVHKQTLNHLAKLSMV